MKIKKKILSIFMSFLMFVSLFTTVPVQAESDTKMFDIDTPTSVEAGEEFEVKFYVNPDGEMAAFQGSLEYDKDAFEYESYEESDYSGLTLYKEKIVATFEPKTMIFAVASLQAKTMPLNGKNDYFYSFKFKAKDTQGKINTSKFNLKIKEYVKSDGQKLGENISVEKTVNFTTPLTGIALNESSFELVKGKEKQLTVSKVPTYATGEIDGSKVQWKSDTTDIATVENGKVVAKKEGTATITATYGEYSATSKVTVKEIHIEKISLSKEALTINKGSTESLTCTIDPKNTTDDKIVTWSSSKPSVVSVDENGQIKALSKGEAIITAKVGSLKATCTVKVTVPLTGITLSATQQQVNVNGTTQLTVTYDPEDASSTDVKYSSNKENVATVDDNGLVNAHARGTATIKATVDGKEATIEITVVQPLTSIELDKEDQTIYKNNTVQFDVNENPKEHDETVTKKEWKSSDDKIATVENGKVTALKEGNAVITVTYTIGDRTLTASRTVHVKENRVKIVTLDNTNIELNKGDKSSQLKTSYTLDYPEEKCDDDTTVKWTTSNDKVATVEDGVVTAVGAGEATITATIAGKKATCTVKVSVPLTGISIKASSNEVIKGKTISLSLSKDPSDSTDTIDSISYVIAEGNEFIKVDNDGKVTGLKEGTAKVYAIAKVGSKEFISKEITINVKEIKITSLDVNVDDKILIGKTAQATATVKPSDTTDDQSVTWSSSDESIATVDQNGVVKALKVGKVKVIATSKVRNDVVGEKEITIYDIPVDSITVENKKVSLTRGETFTNSYTINPSDTTDKGTVTYSSSNEEVATVDQTGKVTALKPGKTTITIQSTERKVSTTYTVDVSNPITVEISGSKDASISNKYKDDILNALPEKTKELINTDAVDVVISIESASIEDEETFNTAHKLLEQVKSTKDYQLGQLFDINLTVKVLKDGQVVSQDTISELNNKIVFALQLPKELINTNSNIKRTYKVVRIHENGQTVEEITNVQLSDDGTSLLIPSDKYSLYAVYYQDTVVENKTEQVKPSTTESVKNDTKQNTHKKQDKKSTKTGDESNTVAYLSMMAASILILLVFCIQKRRTLIK